MHLSAVNQSDEIHIMYKYSNVLCVCMGVCAYKNADIKNNDLFI